MAIGRLVFIFHVLLMVSAMDGGESVMGQSKCNFPVIYNFGDSNSDTGGISAAFFPVPPPNGESFFHKPSGRACDGRLLIDFIAESLGLPYLSAYLDSLGQSFQHGANFATGGSTIQPQNQSLFAGGSSPFSLNVQLSQFSQFKARTNELYKEGKQGIRSRLPKPEDFSKALYTMDIGQNDLVAGFNTKTDDQVKATIPDILNQFSQAVQQLYNLGARAFWIHNTGPIGCLPFQVIYYPLKPRNLDKIGCVKPQNDMAQEFNRQLKDKVIQLRGLLPQAALTYVDVYSAKYALISDAKNQGFVDPLTFCCGRYDGGYHVNCGQKAIANGTEVYGASCGNPSMYISWDGVHYSQAANQWIANHILNRALSDSPTIITQACNRTSQ